MKEFHILNLGIGVQSTTLYLMSMRREFGIPWFDAAIVADPGEESQATYRHLEWLKSLGGPKILVRSAGSRLGDDLMVGGRRGFASIPAFTVSRASGSVGKTKRQCTKEYKTEVIERTVRQEIFGLESGERIAGRFFCHAYLGLSAEETRRVRNNLAVFAKSAWQKAHFPLWAMGWHRKTCLDWLRDKVPHEVPRSACTFCPFHDNAEWARLKESPVDWERACQVDDALRNGALAAKDMHGLLYVHRSCVPLREADLSTDESETHELSFSGVAATDCTGFCGH